MPKLPVILTEPEAPALTTAVMLVEFTIVKVVAKMAPKLTAVILEKLVPVIVTTSPWAANVGVKDVIVGGARKVKPALVTVPKLPVIVTEPVAPPPNTAVMVDEDTTTKEVAGVPPKLTEVTPLVKLEPVIVTVVPWDALEGENEVIVAEGGKKTKSVEDVPVPAGFDTLTKPEAPSPTTAVICVGESSVKEIASTPPKATEDTSEKLAPVIIMNELVVPDVGVKDEISGVL